MTILICSGPLFADWTGILEKQVLEASKRLPVYAELSTLSRDICQQHSLEKDELTWKSFSPDETNLKVATSLLSSVDKEPVFAWADTNSSLFLNFWKAAYENIRFILFYSSPEYEFYHFIKAHKFDETRLESTLDAWLVRMRAMLTFFMNNRDRCLLVDVRTATSAKSLFIQVVNEHFHLELEDVVISVAGNPEISPLVEYLATSLLLKNHDVSELYDEIRSAATVICETDKSISSIEVRNKSLISAFLNEVTAYQRLRDTQSELTDELSLRQLQIKQMAEELEYYFKKNVEQEKITNTMADYLSNDPLLKIARQARQMQ